jgi:hypothetical protein
MIRDRGPDFTAAFDASLAAAGIRTVLCLINEYRLVARHGRGFRHTHTCSSAVHGGEQGSVGSDERDPHQR